MPTREREGYPYGMTFRQIRAELSKVSGILVWVEFEKDGNGEYLAVSKKEMRGALEAHKEHMQMSEDELSKAVLRNFRVDHYGPGNSDLVVE
jgi:hypothetical protein